MEPITLSLRQRKLLNLIQNQTTHITGQALAKQLNVSPRTIRSDIVEINRCLVSCDAKISAERSKGYYLECADVTGFQELFKTDDLLLTREDRIRYLTFQLCLSELPLNQYDLEDEMYVSKTTLENDIATLKRKYTLAPPHIELIHIGDTWEFEANEAKRRTLLNYLFHSDWDYNTTGNAYYSYHFLDDNIMDMIMKNTARLLLKYDFQIEDSNLVTLNLSLAIMYYRMMSGHTLPETDALPHDNVEIWNLCEEIFAGLETELSCSFPPQEKDKIYQHLCNSHLLDASKLNFQTVAEYFDTNTLLMADSYLKLIDSAFHLDLSEDEDFYITLLQYIRHLKIPGHIFNSQGNPNLLRRNLLMESEIAYLFQQISSEYMGYYLDEADLLYLALCVSGALEGYWSNHPAQRIRTVICCHLNLPAIWAIKRKILCSFGNYINVTALMPINARSTYDFSDTDLVLTTVKKQITNQPHVQTLHISPDMTRRDYSEIQQFVSDTCLKFLFRQQEKSLSGLLPAAYWHENLQVTGRFPIIEYLASDFISDHLVSPAYLEDLLRRESIYTYGFQPGALFLYSLVPAARTQLSVATLKHRILWNSSKIRVIIMACFAPSEEPLLLKLLHEIYIDHDNLDYFRKEHSKEELLDFFL
ncbi:MAG: HTH domain-containing protein [Hespellia sp.]|nr:HTH domain-containing protein [Hespellia sp.]